MSLEITGSPYALVDKSTNVVVDIVMWDGTDTWVPPSECYCVGITTSIIGIGMTYNSSGVGIGNTSANKWIVS